LCCRGAINTFHSRTVSLLHRSGVQSIPRSKLIPKRPHIVWSSHHVLKGAAIFLKTQQFRYRWLEVRFTRATAFPHEIVRAIEPSFLQLFQPEEEYRSTGVVFIKLDEDTMIQLDLFGDVVRAERFSRVYQAVDHMREKYGKHTVYLGTSVYGEII